MKTTKDNHQALHSDQPAVSGLAAKGAAVNLKTMETKKCSKCNENKSLEDFYNNKTSTDGKYHYCKKCTRDYGYDNRIEIPENIPKSLLENKSFPLTFSNREELVYWCFLNLSKKEKKIAKKIFKVISPFKPFGKAKKRIFVFNYLGDLIGDYESELECSKKLNITRNNINSAMKRNCFAYKKYYFSTTKDFKIPIKKSNRNPLMKGAPTGAFIDDEY